MKKKALSRGAAIAALAAAFTFLAGCPKSPCPALQEGDVYETELQVRADGSLYALEVETAGSSGIALGEADITAQVTAIADDHSTFELLGTLTVMVELGAQTQLTVEDLAVGGWIRVAGALGEDGLLHATAVGNAGEKETELVAVLENLTGATFEMIGLVIAHDDETQQECEDEGGEDDDDGDDDDDDEGEDDD